jgi:hypothetical protein
VRNLPIRECRRCDSHLRSDRGRDRSCTSSPFAAPRNRSPRRRKRSRNCDVAPLNVELTVYLVKRIGPESRRGDEESQVNWLHGQTIARTLSVQEVSSDGVFRSARPRRAAAHSSGYIPARTQTTTSTTSGPLCTRGIPRWYTWTESLYSKHPDTRGTEAKPNYRRVGSD